MNAKRPIGSGFIEAMASAAALGRPSHGTPAAGAGRGRRAAANGELANTGAVKRWILALAMALVCGIATEVGAAALNVFHRTANAAIPGHNIERLTGVAPEACAAACTGTPSASWCRSFDYDKTRSRCDLSDRVGTEVGLKTTYNGDRYDHYSLKPAADPLSRFVVTADAAISGFNTEMLRGVTPLQCAAACAEFSRAGWCKSFDFNRTTGRCDLSEKRASEVGGLKTTYAGDPYDHYALSPVGGRPNPLPGNKHVLLIGLDGVRGDAIHCEGCVATPALSALIAGGAFHSNVLAGGAQDTLSGPGWSTVFTGFWADQHGVTSNDVELELLRPHVFDRIKLAYPLATVAVVGDWPNITGNLAPRMADFKVANSEDDSKEATDTVIGWLRLPHPPTAIFHYLHGADIHAPSYDPSSPLYRSRIAGEDAQIGRVLDALRARANYQGEQWLVLVTSDHGGRGSSHGGQSAAERRSFLILNNNFRNPSYPSYCTGDLTATALSQADGATPHILDFLGLPNTTAGRKHPAC